MLKQIKLGDTLATDILLARYRPYCHSLSIEMLDKVDNSEIQADDLFSIAFSAVATAIRSYDENKENAAFYAYWSKIAKNDIIRYVKKMKNTVTRVSLDTVLSDGRCLHDLMGENDAALEEDTLHSTFMKIIDNPNNNLNEKERTLLRYYLDGYDFKEIALLMDCSKSKTYYLFKNAINKIRDIMTGSK